MSINKKKTIIIFLLFFAVGSAAWFSFAAYSKKWLESRINLLIADLRETGCTLSYSTLDITINPFFVQAHLQNPHLIGRKGVMEWKGQEIKIFIRPWERFTLNFSLLGEQKFSVAHIPSLGILHLEGAKGSLSLTSKGHLETTSFTIGNLSSFLENHLQPLTLQDTSVNISNMTDPLHLHMSLMTRVTNLEKLFNKELISPSLTVNFIGDLSGFQSHLPFPKSLTEWQEGGGVLEVRLLNIDWPPIIAEVEGTITLDQEMYPLGAFSSRISGYREALDHMVALGWIKQKKVSLILFMLDLLSSTNEKGEKQLKAPLTLQNKSLSIGSIRLLKLRPLEVK